METLGTLIFAMLAGLAGLVIGAVINMLADDLPYTLRIRPPHYPDGTPRPRSAWLGVLAFVLGRRVSPASQPVTGPETEPETAPVPDRLSWRHPIAELVTAALFVYIALQAGLSGKALFLMGSVAILILITVIDLEHRMILYAVIFPSYVYALVGVALVGPEISERITFRDYLIGGGAGFIVFGVLYLGGMAFSALMANARGQELEEVAFGFGDVMLATLSGLLLGWQALLFAVTIAVFAGGGGALLYLAFRLLARGRYEMFTALPYGQYIVFGTLVMLLWRTPVINLLQRVG